ncbi:hypothetical protein AAKU55_001418 [Oxalobacteraceae bacterium GrIS 1.11]
MSYFLHRVFADGAMLFLDVFSAFPAPPGPDHIASRLALAHVCKRQIIGRKPENSFSRRYFSLID